LTLINLQQRSVVPIVERFVSIDVVLSPI
jgi:hypothetical protein